MDLDGNGGWSPLKMALHEGKIQATFNIGSNPELPSRGHFLCGEQAKCHVLLTFRNGLKPSEELASSISAQIENFEVSVDTGNLNGSAPANGTRKTGVSDTALFVAKEDFRRRSRTSPTIHKMHSIESLTSFSQETLLSPKQTAKLQVARSRAQGQLWNEYSIYIPLEIWVDSPLDFTEAHVHVSVSIFERRRNDVIKELLSKPKLGSVLLRDLLLEDASEALLNPSVTERLWSIDKIFRILRPITAEMKCTKVSPAQLNLCVTVANSLVAEKSFADESAYTIDHLELRPEETIHGNRHVINIHPHNHPSQTIQLRPSDKADFEFHLRMNKAEPSAHFPRLRLLVALNSKEIEDTEGIHLAFESDLNLDELFPERQADAIIVSLSGKCRYVAY